LRQVHDFCDGINDQSNERGGRGRSNLHNDNASPFRVFHLNQLKPQAQIHDWNNSSSQIDNPSHVLGHLWDAGNVAQTNNFPNF
jgi:hypothetical protein